MAWPLEAHVHTSIYAHPRGLVELRGLIQRPEMLWDSTWLAEDESSARELLFTWTGSGQMTKNQKRGLPE